MIRVDKKLKAAASFNPTKKSHFMSIGDMCNEIEKQSISLPLYQRDLSWTIAKCISLLNYQLLGKAPVSPISVNVINDTSKCVPQVSFISREVLHKIERGQNSIVDGQQRLTTNYKAYMNHEDFRNIVLDLGKGKFIEVRESIQSHQIPVGVLLNKDDALLFNYAQQHSSLDIPEVKNLFLQIKSKIRNYNYTINEAVDLSEDEQIEWFEVLNNAGSRVSRVQMRFAKLKASGIDIYAQYTKPFRNRIEEAGYGRFFTPQKTTTSYPVAALNPAYEVVTEREHSSNFAPYPSDLKENQICNLSPDKLRKCFSLTLEALDTALDFIAHNDIKKLDRIDYINYLIGFFVFNGRILDNKTEQYLIEWCNDVNFTNKSNSARRQIYKRLIEKR